MKNKRFRLLKEGELVFRSKGDQFQDQGNGFWIMTHEEGTFRVGKNVRYRRPIHLKESDLEESTAEYT